MIYTFVSKYIYQNRSPASCPAAPGRGTGTSTAYPPNAAFRFAYGSAVVICRTGECLPFAKPASSSSSSSSSPALPSRSSNPPSMPPSAGSGGGGLKVLTGSEDGSDEAPGSIGPGPCTTTGPDTGPSRCTGTRSCLDIGFSAGESASALPAAPRMNVWPDEENKIGVINGERCQVGYSNVPLDSCDKCCPVSPCAATVGRALHDPCGLRPS